MSEYLDMLYRKQIKALHLSFPVLNKHMPNISFSEREEEREESKSFLRFHLLS